MNFLAVKPAPELLCFDSAGTFRECRQAHHTQSEGDVSMRLSFLVLALVSICLPEFAISNAQITSATWTPGAEHPVELQQSPALVAIDSVAATGWIDVGANLLGQVRDPAVAFRIEYESDPPEAFTLGDGAQFHSVERARIQTTRAGANTRAAARIVMVDRVFFDPNLIEVQVLRIWIGNAQTMTVHPTNGVSGAAFEAAYRVQTTAPSITIIPDRRSVEGPIDRPSLLSCTLFQLEPQPSPRVYSLSYSGPAGVIEALHAPNSVTVSAGLNGASFVVDFDPYRSLIWPNRNSTVSVTATSNGESVTGYLHFSGPLLLSPYDFPAGITSVEPEPIAQKRCVPASVLAPQPSKPTSCGACVKMSVTPTCPADSPGPTGSYLWYNKYSCPSGETSCTETQHTSSYQGTDCEQFNRPCQPEGGIFSRIFPVTIGSQVATAGHQCCFKCTPTENYATYTFPTCQ